MPAWLGITASAAARWAAFFALYLLLADNVQEPELITGIAAAGLAAIASTALHCASGMRVAPPASALRHAYRLPVQLVTDTLIVSWALIRRLAGGEVHGRLRAVRYGAIETTPEAVARRAMTEWAVTLTPNRYAVGIDVERGILVVHELVASSSPVDPLELG